MIIEIALGVTGYIPVGLLSARRIKFAMENSTDRDNAVARKNKEACQERYHDYCGHEVVTTYRKEWDGLYVGLPVWGGIFWPLTAVGTGCYQGYKVVAHGTGPFFKWFFENPKHRKQSQVTVVTS